MPIQLNNCPLCNSGHFHNYVTCKDHSVSQETFTIVRCDNCDFAITNPRPGYQHLPRYYQSQEYISHSNKSTSLINFIYRIARRFTLKNKLKILSKHAAKGSLLDIGAGTGHFLSTCRKAGWKTTGVEPSKIARDQIHSSIPAYEDLSQITEKYYNAITMWHVLEHIPELNTFLEKVNNILKADGTLIVAVPNYQSFDAQYYNEYWAAYDVPRHLYHFEQKTMAQLLKKHGFYIKNILPMKLDAFYVSMLSEKYKNGKNNFTKSIINGCKSNVYAKKNDNNYSSLIYIIKKKQ